MERIKMALVGCGGIMEAHMLGVQELKTKGMDLFDIVATCDVDEGRARARADQVEKMQGRKPQVFTEFRTMLEKVREIEAVDICTLHSNHHTVAVPCLEAGKHVLLEKPLAISIRTAKLILDAAARSRTALVVGENYRFEEGQRMRRWVVQSGRIGKPRVFLWLDFAEQLGKWGWRNFKHDAGGGWVLDGGVHFADLFRFHLGREARRVQALTRQFEPFRYEDQPNRGKAWAVTVEDSSWALIEFDDDIVVQWTTVHAAPGAEFNRQTICGSEGALDWDKGLVRRNGTIVDNKTLLEEFRASLSAEQKEKFFPGGITEHTFAIELKEFADTVRHGTVPELTGMEGFKDLAICMALFESAWHGRAVTLQEIERCELEGYQRDLNV